MRSAILIFLAILAFATTPARAQGTWLETRLTRAVCSGKATPAANTDRLAKRLNLTDPQKAALKDLADASTSADASAKTSLCADKPDFSTTPGTWMRSRRKRSTRVGASAASSIGGARNKRARLELAADLYHSRECPHPPAPS